MLAGKPSCVWSEGLEMAAARGDLEMVKLLVSIEKAKEKQAKAKDNKTAIVAGSNVKKCHKKKPIFSGHGSKHAGVFAR